MSKIEVNAIEPQCGTNLTVGASGDTITFPSGTTIVNNGTQTGFGRTGTVDWDTTAKTASFTAVSGNGYFINTTSGAITVTMPATPSAGDIVGIKDYAGTFATNNVTVGRNGSNFDGVATDPVLTTDQLSVFFVYVDGTQGWKATQSDSGSYGSLFVTATGGTIATCGDYKIHTFTGPGTFCVSCAGNACGSETVDYMVIAGGGGSAKDRGGAGGAGGYRESSGAASGCYTASPLGACVSALPVTAQGYPISVGGGGAACNSPPYGPGSSGSTSIFSTITSTGGGGGGRTPSCGVVGLPGGSGGAAGNTGGGSFPGGSGNTPPVSPPQGNPGGAGSPAANYATGGSGGAGGSGGNGTPNAGGDAGTGVTTSISGSATGYAGGGSGSVDCNNVGSPAAAFGGGVATSGAATAGAANTGGGGGSGSDGGDGGNGGSGIVIIRYKYQ